MRKWFPFFLLFITIPVFSNTTIMPLKDVKAGMKGYGLTVIQGSIPTRFEVEVIDVLHNVAPKRNLILAKFSGANIEKTGVAQGMSGSPVYIEGKLIGALAYTWGYLREPIGGIQPIEGMLSVLEKQKEFKRPPLEFAVLDEKIAQAKPGGEAGVENSATTKLKRIATPLLISGFTPNVFEFFKDKFRDLGFEIYQGGSAGSTGAADKDPLDAGKAGFEPGDAVGIQMATGDANVAAIGTVTHVTPDNKVLIFGHPFMNRGFFPYPMPLTQVKIHQVMPTWPVSWKFGSATRIVGQVFRDQDTAVAGEVGKAASLFPVSIEYEGDQSKAVFSYKLIPDPLFFPNLFAGLVMSSIYSQDGKASEGSIQVDFEVKIKRDGKKESETLTISDFFIGPNEKALHQGVLRLLSPLQFLIYNWFEGMRVEEIKAKIKKIPAYQVANLEKAVVMTPRVKSGETAKVRIYLRLFQGGVIDQVIDFPIPKNLPSGPVLLTISSAKLEYVTAMFQYPAKFYPKSYEQLMELLNLNSSFTRMAVWIDAPQSSAIVEGHFLPNLPISKLANFAYRENGNSFFRSRRNMRIQESNYLISGILSVPIDIDEN